MNLLLGKHHSGREVFLSDEERRRHIYITGKTGTGKSTLLQNLMLQDLEMGRGFALLDPHGDLAEAITDSIPPERTNDVLYLDPLDPDYVVGFDPLGHVPDFYQANVAAQVVSALKHIWADTWGARMNYILTNAIRLLLASPRYTLVDLPRLLTDKPFRTSLLRRCKDTFVVDFWVNEFDRYPDRQRAEAISPIQNKVGQFANNPILRSIIGSRSTLDVEDVMNNRRVVLANLSKRMGEEPSHLLGALLVTAFAQAAERRATIPEAKRQDFTLYVDEFQNFATESFAAVLAEARKWRLNVVLANQFLDQVPEIVQKAVIGNVGTLIVFRVGSFDAPVLSKELELSENVLTNIPNHRARAKLLNDGNPTEPILLEMLPANPKHTGRIKDVQRQSRDRFAHKRT